MGIQAASTIYKREEKRGGWGDADSFGALQTLLAQWLISAYEKGSLFAHYRVTEYFRALFALLGPLSGVIVYGYCSRPSPMLFLIGVIGKALLGILLLTEMELPLHHQKSD
ncbi:hypothetical protein K469DRAFT_713950 [Zopfia rhizophila CBS 207.26]|uniref:Uncharacterized protein n=1 Tax=Zopfia rhizophila CBS 207.26 TaxID=1314779 RepID=A0A6A6DSY3_9PEZI|nr:hypothetical protein K469DRAFT_713950 [Zopfia rhizophila CBS 207.26]